MQHDAAAPMTRLRPQARRIRRTAAGAVLRPREIRSSGARIAESGPTRRYAWPRRWRSVTSSRAYRSLGVRGRRSNAHNADARMTNRRLDVLVARRRERPSVTVMPSVGRLRVAARNVVQAQANSRSRRLGCTSSPEQDVSSTGSGLLLLRWSVHSRSKTLRMLPSGSLNHSALAPGRLAIPSFVFSPGTS